jgi:hypothetical protein
MLRASGSGKPLTKFLRANRVGYIGAVQSGPVQGGAPQVGPAEVGVAHRGQLLCVGILYSRQEGAVQVGVAQVGVQSGPIQGGATQALLRLASLTGGQLSYVSEFFTVDRTGKICQRTDIARFVRPHMVEAMSAFFTLTRRPSSRLTLTC